MRLLPAGSKLNVEMIPKRQVVRLTFVSVTGEEVALELPTEVPPESDE